MDDSLTLVKLLEIKRFHAGCFLFTIDFKSLYTNIPVEDAIRLIIALVKKFDSLIQNADFVIELLQLVLRNSLMEYDGEYFQQIFGIIMGTPILANIYLALLEKELKEKQDKKLVWPVLFKRFIDDGFGIFEGTIENITYWISEFCKLRDRQMVLGKF